MVEKTISQLVICSAYKEPTEHWEYDSVNQGFTRMPGRRQAEYRVAAQTDDTSVGEGQLIPLELVNRIRPRVKTWRDNGYPGVTSITRKLLDWWHTDDVRDHPFFFCELDAIETLIWLTESPAAERVGINIPTDGSLFKRLCTKLCTGGGKTIVMSMLIAWQICNKAAYPQDKRFSKHVLVMAPGLTVKDRLGVLLLGGDDNYYTRFNVVPTGLQPMLRQGEVQIHNWQSMTWETEEQLAKRKTVDKRGPMSDTAYARSILGSMAKHHNLLVINDEAHHAWRTNPEVKISLRGEDRKEYVAERQQATAWIGALDRIHRACGILVCCDFSATPFTPSGNRTGADALYGWIVSDFSLNDGIESGLVKTPRMIVKDDTYDDPVTGRSRLLRLYSQDEVKQSLNRADATPETPLPKLVCSAYNLLASDWKRTYDEWKRSGSPVPPVMISVANRIETSARIEYMFDHHSIQMLPSELCDPEHTLRIDSKLIDGLDNGEKAKSVQEEQLREKVSTVGQPGRPGATIRHLISVGMLSEGWDAHTVTHIMGLRAFTSQLLCEQVIGRGLRRTSYDIDETTGLFRPEYVNVLGIPMEFLPHETSGGKPRENQPRTMVNVVQDRNQYEIHWPNVTRINNRERTELKFDVNLVPPLTIDTEDIPFHAELARILAGKPETSEYSRIDLMNDCRNIREQTIIFRIAASLLGQSQHRIPDTMTTIDFIPQAIRCVQEYLDSDRIRFNPPLSEYGEPEHRKAFIILSANEIVNHMFEAVSFEPVTTWEPVFDEAKRVNSTGEMATWYTKKPCRKTRHSQISQCVIDSGWEETEASTLDDDPNVLAWVKNDAHVGFTIDYRGDDGLNHHYIPDFLIRLKNGTTLILETKGRNSADVQRKRQALQAWVSAVNNTHEYGHWAEDISWNPRDINAIIDKHTQEDKA